LRRGWPDLRARGGFVKRQRWDLERVYGDLVATTGAQSTPDHGAEGSDGLSIFLMFGVDENAARPSGHCNINLLEIDERQRVVAMVSIPFGRI
jgi:hypothetical protein